MDRKKIRKSTKVVIVAILTFLMCLALSACGVAAGSKGKDNLIVDNGEVETGEKVAYATGGELQFPASALVLSRTVNFSFNGTVSSEGGIGGSSQSFLMKSGHVYKLEVWGAQGADGSGADSGGYGGYAVGYYDMSSKNNLTIYVSVGGKGAVKRGSGTGAGGWNGGGGTNNSDRYSGGGGGATHIAARTGVLSGLSSYKGEVLIVAGGGGGAWHGANQGGSGGGENGGVSSYSSGNVQYHGRGGTQSSGGAGGTYSGYQGGVGSFGQGGAGAYNADGSYSGYGGGGGWYGGGGGSGYNNGNAGGHGGGGSGYVGNVQYLSSVVESTAMMREGVRSGHGYATITEYQAVNMKNPEVGVTGSTIATSLQRGQSVSIVNDKMATEPIDTNVALTYAVMDDLYLDAGFATSATAKGYVTVTNGSSTSITVTPKLSMLNTTLYAKMHCSNPSFDIGIPVKFTTTDQAMTPKGTKNTDNTEIYDGLKIDGKTDMANFGKPNETSKVPTSPNTNGLVYNPNGNTVKTLYIRKPIGTNSTLKINASDIYSGT